METGNTSTPELYLPDIYDCTDQQEVNLTLSTGLLKRLQILLTK